VYLPLVAQLLGYAPHVLGGRLDLVAGLGRALVDLIAEPAAGLCERAAALVLGQLGLVADLVLDLVDG
jgi:hypothetical protein